MNRSWVVLKFGGTSVASPRALRRAAVVVARAQRDARVAVVVSALAGATSALDVAASLAARGEHVAAAVVGRLRRRHRRLLHQVAPNEAQAASRALEPVLTSVREHLEHAALTRSLTPARRAQVLAAGERLSVQVFAALLRARGLAAAASDGTAWLVAHGEPLEAEPDTAATRERTARALLDVPVLPVITGFLAADATGATVLLGRGGSDLSATLLAAALDASRVEIFTDTSGVLSADPRLEPLARVHRTLTPAQASRLARLGARVLHPRTFEPLRSRGAQRPGSRAQTLTGAATSAAPKPREIPVWVRDTFHPERPGTRISSHASLHTGEPGDAAGREVLATVVSGPALVRVAAGSGLATRRLAALLCAHDVPAVLSRLDDSLMIPVSAVACARAAGIAELRFTPGPLGARLVAVSAPRHAPSPDAVGRALANAGVFPLAPPASALPGVTAAVVAEADVPAATRALHAAAVGGAESRVDVVLAGARGRVGRALLARLSRDTRAREPRLRLVAAFDTRGHVTDSRGLEPAQVARLLETAPPRPLAVVLGELRADGAPLLFIDCTASEAVAARHASLLTRGIAVVTANKHGLAAPGARWRALQQAARYAPLRASTTVGAGMPVLSTVRALRRRGDALVSVRASLSGTLAYVLASAHAGVPLSRAVEQAHALGFTEPNPAADLSGADVARKLVIVLRAAGIAIEPGEIHVEPLVGPAVLRATDVATLVAQLVPGDEAFAQRVQSARAAGKRWVYTASYDGTHARVGLTQVDEHDALALARPGENVVRLRTALHDRVPLVISGPGAGVAVTAAGVHGDVLSAARALIARSRRGPVSGPALAGGAWAGGARHHPAWA